MNPIRPNPPPTVTMSQAVRPADGRLAAQKAFFALAAGRAAAAAAAEASAPMVATRTIAPTPAGQREAGPLRPGSLLDIRV